MAGLAWLSSGGLMSFRLSLCQRGGVDQKHFFLSEQKQLFELLEGRSTEVAVNGAAMEERSLHIVFFL